MKVVVAAALSLFLSLITLPQISGSYFSLCHFLILIKATRLASASPEWPLCFTYCWFPYFLIFFFFNATSPGSLRWFPWNLPHDQKWVQFYNLGPKIWRYSPKKFGDQKLEKFGEILYNFRLQ